MTEQLTDHDPGDETTYDPVLDIEETDPDEWAGDVLPERFEQVGRGIAVLSLHGIDIPPDAVNDFWELRGQLKLLGKLQ